MSRRFTYSAILVVALPLIAAAGFLYARGTGGYESATGHKSISHEAPPPTIDPRNSDGNPDSPQVVVFLATIVDVTVGS